MQDKLAFGRVGKVMCEGKSPAVYGALVTAGNSPTSDASGRLVPATGSNAIVAIAAESGSADEIHSVYVVSRAASGAIQKSILSIPIKPSNVANGDVLANFPAFPVASREQSLW